MTPTNLTCSPTERSDAVPDIRLTLRPLPDAVPADVRLRRLLKRLLRSYGFRCVNVEALPPGPDKARAPAADSGQTG
jgi:hypothetical protein